MDIYSILDKYKEKNKTTVEFNKHEAIMFILNQLSCVDSESMFNSIEHIINEFLRKHVCKTVFQVKNYNNIYFAITIYYASNNIEADKYVVEVVDEDYILEEHPYY